MLNFSPQTVFATLLVLAVIATLAAQMRILPAQNVFTTAALIALISGAVQTLGAKTGIPFGRFLYAEIGPDLLHTVPWAIPLMWVVIVFNSRGIARLILRPWRKLPNYGYWIIVLTCVLAVIFDLSLEPFASRANHFWIWLTSTHTPAWYGAPWVNFIAWATTTLLILGIITPWLINKKPIAKAPPDYAPLILWLALTVIMNMDCVMRGLWWAAAVGLASSSVIGVISWRNSRW